MNNNKIKSKRDGSIEVSFKKAITSGDSILFYNPSDGEGGEEQWCDTDEFLTLIGNVYTTQGLRDYIAENKFYLQGLKVKPRKENCGVQTLENAIKSSKKILYYNPYDETDTEETFLYLDDYFIKIAKEYTDKQLKHFIKEDEFYVEYGIIENGGSV